MLWRLSLLLVMLVGSRALLSAGETGVADKHRQQKWIKNNTPVARSDPLLSPKSGSPAAWNTETSLST